MGPDVGITPLAPTTAFRLERKLPGGLSSSHWNQAPFHGAPEFFALPVCSSDHDIRQHSPFSPNAEPQTPNGERRTHAPALYTPSLSRQIGSFMEVDFQAIKLEELKSRLGELRRYL